MRSPRKSRRAISRSKAPGCRIEWQQSHSVPAQDANFFVLFPAMRLKSRIITSSLRARWTRTLGDGNLNYHGERGKSYWRKFLRSNKIQSFRFAYLQSSDPTLCVFASTFLVAAPCSPSDNAKVPLARLVSLNRRGLRLGLNAPLIQSPCRTSLSSCELVPSSVGTQILDSRSRVQIHHQVAIPSCVLRIQLEQTLLGASRRSRRPRDGCEFR